MISTWVEAGGAAVVILLWIIVPGTALNRVFAAPLRWALALAPVNGIAVLAASAVVYQKIGWAWDSATVIPLVLILVAMDVALRWRSRWLQEWPEFARRLSPRSAWAAIVAWAVAAAFGAYGYIRAKGSADAVSQVHDSMFHTNLVSYFIKTHQGSSLQAGYMDGSMDPNNFYPSAWHDVVVLTAEITSTDVTVVMSAFDLVLLAVVWPLGLAVLARVIFGHRPFLMVGAFLASGLFGSFPWRFMSYGLLSSNLLGMSVLPAALALVIVMVRRIASGHWPRVWQVLAFLTAFVGICLAQPNTVFSAVVILLPFMYVMVWQGFRGTRVRPIWAVLAFTVVVCGAWTVLYRLPALQRTVTWPWPKQADFRPIFEPTLMGSFTTSPIQVLPVLLAVAGMVCLLKVARQQVWVIFSYLIAISLYLLSYTTDGPFKDVLTGFWYHDFMRLAALTAFVMALLAAVGIGWILEGVQRALAARWGALLAVTGSAVIVIAMLGYNYVSAGMVYQRDELHKAFDAENGPLLNTEEAQFLKQAKAITKDQGVVNNPYDGSGYGYAEDDMNVLFRALYGNWMGTWNPETEDTVDNLSAKARTSCPVIDGQRYPFLIELDAGTYYNSGRPQDIPWRGLFISDQDSSYVTVFSQGDMRLRWARSCGESPTTAITS